MNSEINTHINYSPNEKFRMYFQVAKDVYCQMHSCDKVTQKDMVVWYNEKYEHSLTEASLSKYLKGENEIPVRVYLNMKDLAGIEDIWLGAGASREEYELAFDLQESLDFIRDEVESLCHNEQVQDVCGSSISQIMNTFVEYCEAVSKRNYLDGLKKLGELQNVICDAEKYILVKKESSLCVGENQVKSMAVQSMFSDNINLNRNNNISIYNELIDKFRLLEEKIEECIVSQRKTNK